MDNLRLIDEKQGEEAIEFPGVSEACPESGSVDGAGCRRFGSRGSDLSATMSSARTTGASNWPSLVWLWTADGKFSIRPSLPAMAWQEQNYVNN